MDPGFKALILDDLHTGAFGSELKQQHLCQVSQGKQPVLNLALSVSSSRLKDGHSILFFPLVNAEA